MRAKQLAPKVQVLEGPTIARPAQRFYKYPPGTADRGGKRAEFGGKRDARD